MPYVATYRTLSGLNYFKFSFEEQSDGDIHIHILDMPSYGSRNTGGHETHRYGISSGRPYICFDPMPRNQADAVKIAKAWAECTEKYIRWGITF